MKPADFDSTRKYPLLFFVYGGPGNTETDDMWGNYCLWHMMLNQKGYLVAIVDNRGTPAAARPPVPQGDLRPDGRARDPGSGDRGPDAGAAGLRGLEPGRHLGLELRRLHEPQRAVPAPRDLSDRHRRLAGDALGAVRQRVYRAVQRPDRREPRGLRPRVTDQLRERQAGRSAAGPRRRRRQRALPEQRGPDQRPGGRQQAVRVDGVSQPHALHLPGEEHHGPSVRDDDPFPRPHAHAARRADTPSRARAAAGQ